MISIGRNYIVITTNPSEMLRIAGDLNMVDTGSQWLFLLSVVNNSDPTVMMDVNHPEGLAASIREGGNVAFAINTTQTGKCEVIIIIYLKNHRCLDKVILFVFTLAQVILQL